MEARVSTHWSKTREELFLERKKAIKKFCSTDFSLEVSDGGLSKKDSLLSD